MKFEEYLLNTEDEFNGHKQTIIKNFSIKKGLKLCKKLEKLVNKEYSFVLEVWTDGSYTIYQKEFFEDGRTGGTDRIILGVDNS